MAHKGQIGAPLELVICAPMRRQGRGGPYDAAVVTLLIVLGVVVLLVLFVVAAYNGLVRLRNRIATTKPRCVRGKRLHGYGCMYAW